MKEKLKNYFDLELKTTIVYSIVAVVTGYASFLVRQPIYGFLVALAVFAGVMLLLSVAFKTKKEKKGTMGNFLFFILFWFVVYTVFYNI